MYKERSTTETVEKPKSPENQKTSVNVEKTAESAEEIGEKMLNNSEKEFAAFKVDQAAGEAELAKDEIRAEKDGHEIDGEDKQKFQDLNSEAIFAKEELIAKIGNEQIMPKENVVIEKKQYTEDDLIVLRNKINVLADIGNCDSGIFNQMHELAVQRVGDKLEWKKIDDVDIEEINRLVELANIDIEKKNETAKREAVLMEALNDFTDKSSGATNNPKWEGDAPMQGMEDFINVQRKNNDFEEAFNAIGSLIGEKMAKIDEKVALLDSNIYIFSKNVKNIFTEIINSAENKRKKEKIGELKKKLGSTLETSEDSSVTTKEHLEHLALIPDSLLLLLKDKGLKIRIGDRDVVGLSEDVYFKNNAPRGWKNKANWIGVSGCYCSSKNEKVAYVGSLHPGGTSSIALHEYGHGVGDLLGLNNTQETITAHERFYDKLCSYLQQDGPGGEAGRQEFIAESFSDFFTLSKEKFSARYDKEWHTYLEKNINNA